jgi:hypothetical protein
VNSHPLGIPFDQDHVNIGFIATWDWGDNTLENVFRNELDHSVHLISGFIACKYNFLPDRGVNVYVGAGAGILWLRRILGEGFDMLHAPGELQIGVTEIGGIEFRLTSRWQICFPVKHYFGLGEFSDKIHNNTYFQGGKPYGWNFGIGFKYSW